MLCNAVLCYEQLLLALQVQVPLCLHRLVHLVLPDLLLVHADPVRLQSARSGVTSGAKRGSWRRGATPSRLPKWDPNQWARLFTDAAPRILAVLVGAEPLVHRQTRRRQLLAGRAQRGGGGAAQLVHLVVLRLASHSAAYL